MHYDADLSHLTCVDYADIYEPAEDSYLLCDALIQDKTFIQQRFHSKPLLQCVEIGAGTGFVIGYLAALMKDIRSKNQNCLFLSTDINPKACLATQATMTAIRNKMQIKSRDGKDRIDSSLVSQVISCSLLDSVKSRLCHQIDVLLFNPPYVETDRQELIGWGLNRSWAGGERGRQIIDEILTQIKVTITQQIINLSH